MIQRIAFASLVFQAAVVLLQVSPAPAALDDQAVSCRAAIAKSSVRLLGRAAKTITSCHKARDKDASLVAMDCNDLAVADAAKGKYAAAVAKFVEAVGKGCADQAAALTAAGTGREKERYVSCAVDPCEGVSGVIDTVEEIGSCLACVVAEVAGNVAGETLGLPDPAMLEKDERKCRSALAKGYGRYLTAAYKAETSCQRDEDGAGNNALDACRDTAAGDARGKAASALAKAAQGLDSACAAASLAEVGGCSTADLAALSACTAAAWTDAEDDAFVATYEMPATVCPTSIRTTIHAGCSTAGSAAGECTSGNQTDTSLSFGWTGRYHGADVPDASTLAVGVTCEGSEAGSCGTCTSTGISQDNPDHAQFTRCLDDPWTECSNPFGTDPACNGGAGGACEYFLGPPLAISGSGLPTCTLEVLGTDIAGGTWHAELGEADFDVDVRWRMHLGVSQTRPCPICRDDATPQDGARDGACLGGPRDGEPCDVQGFDLSFAATQADAPTAGVSLDCPPYTGSNITGSGLRISLPLTTGASALGAAAACESAPGLDCFCGVCSGGDGTVACRNDDECGLAGLGSCGKGSGADRQPNNCADGICYPVPGEPGRGACSSDVAMTPDLDSYCDGALRADGSGFLSCGQNADCDAYISGSVDPDQWVCPGDDCGDCTATTLRSCFPDPIEANGEPDPVSPTVVATFCVGPTSGSGRNTMIGLPGPGLLRADTTIEMRY